MCNGPETRAAWLVQEMYSLNGEHTWYSVGQGNSEAVLTHCGQIVKGLE